MILAIDPGAKAIGWSIFNSGLLKDCGLLRGATPLDICNLAKDRFGLPDFDEVVIEIPQSYSQHHLQKGPQQDLITIAFVGGMVVGATHPAKIRTVFPHEWKGSVPGDIMIQRIRKRLSAKELALVDAVKPASLRHNCEDSIGAGLWACGRL